MYRLFKELPPTDRGTQIVPEFVYVRGSYQRELAKVVNYYQQFTRWTENQHILIKMLTAMNVSFKREYLQYTDLAGEQMFRLSTGLRITSPLEHGKIFTNGYFYNDKCQEVLIIHRNRFDLQDGITNWRDLRPVRILRHPFTDLSLGLPNGKYKSNEHGIVVVEINAAMLALQFRRWYEEEKGTYGEVDTRTIHMFISMYPMVNALYSHLDLCYFNRMNAIMHGEPVEGFNNPHPFGIVDYTGRVDNAIKQTLEVQERRPLTFDHILCNIPMISSPTLFETMQLPDTVVTRQIKWALIVSRIPVIRFLVKLNHETDNEKNRWYLSQLRIALKEMRNDRILQSGLPTEFYQEIENTISTKIETYLV